MTLDLMKIGCPIVAFENEGAGGSGGDAAAAPPPVAPAGDAGGDAPATIAGAVFGEGQDTQPGGEDTQAGGDKPAEVEKKEGDDAGKEVAAPEPFASAIPEGLEAYGEQFTAYDTAVNSFLTEKPDATAREALAWAAEHQSNQAKEAGKALRAQFETTISGWETEAKADADLGKDFDATLKAYGHGLRSFGSQPLIDVLNESGLGSHPEVIRAFAKIGKASQESPILGGEGGKGNVSFADSVYGKKG